jgi:hypothetical protein
LVGSYRFWLFLALWGLVRSKYAAQRGILSIKKSSGSMAEVIVAVNSQPFFFLKNVQCG